MREYYKKVDKSFFKYGITIPKDYIESFICGDPLELGTSRDVLLRWGKYNYTVKLVHVKREKSSAVYQLRWDNNRDFLTELKKEFIQSYFAIESENFAAKQENKYYITKLLGGNQEVMIFNPISSQEIEIKTFIKIETPYDNLFKRLVEENVFGWISNVDKHNRMITKSTKWFDISELPKHEDASFVVYYLIDEQNKEVYIGSAARLGDRVKPSRREIPHWNKFRYEILHPQFHANLREVEYHSIMNFARFLPNDGNLSNIGFSEYRLVNKDYKFYQK